MPLIQIDFDANDRDYDFEKRVSFWESMRFWFSERGYLLYRYDYEWNGKPLDHAGSTSPQFVFEGEVQHPYSFSGGDSSELKSPPLNNDVNVRAKQLSLRLIELLLHLKGRVAYAQDAQHRHVAIKLVKDSSQEYNILRFLSQQPSLYSPDTFPCIIPPIDFLEFEGHWFVVMPR
jgi:hypothetical protein